MHAHHLLFSISLLSLLLLLHRTPVHALPTAKSLNPHHLPTLLLIPRATIDCFSDTVAPFLVPINPTDCYRAGHMIHCENDITTPITFSRSPPPPLPPHSPNNPAFPPTYSAPRLQVPHSWNYGSCVIALDIKSLSLTQDQEETASLTEVGAKALEILIGCVEQGTRLGGRESVGRRGNLLVAIAGRPRNTRASPPPPPQAQVPAMQCQIPGPRQGQSRTGDGGLGSNIRWDS